MSHRTINVIKRRHEKNDATDIALLVSTSSKAEINIWDKSKIVDSLVKETGASYKLAQEIADAVEKKIFESGFGAITTSMIRELIDIELLDRGLSIMHKKHTSLGLPMYDVEQIILNANKENSNTTHNPESINLTIAEAILKEFALRKVFSEDVALAHLIGDIHLHDLGFIVRPYSFMGDSVIYCRQQGSDSISTVSMGQLYNSLPFETTAEEGVWIKYPRDIEVLDRDNKWVKVIRVVQKSRANKRMIFIRTSDGKACIVTDDHPVIMAEGTKPAREVEKGDKLTTVNVPAVTESIKHLNLVAELSKNGSMSRYAVVLNDEKIPLGKVHSYIAQGQAKAEDYSKAYVRTIKGSDVTLPVSLPLTEELGWLVGFHIAEGHSEDSSLSFTCSPGEEQEKLISILESLNVSFEQKAPNRICVNSTLIRDLFREVLKIGSAARTKSLPANFMNYPRSFLRGLIGGIIDGDGTIDKNSASIRLASARLVNQLSIALELVGLSPSCRKPQGVGSVRHWRGRTITQNYPIFGIAFGRKKEVGIPSFKYQKLPCQTRESTLDPAGEVQVTHVVEVDIPDEHIYDITTESGTLICNGIYSHNCGGHSLEYIKKYGLALPNITSTSRPAKHPEVLIGHMVKMASSLQSHYAGAVGWEAVNIFFAPYLVGLSYDRIKQLAQMLIYEFNQLAGARGSLRGKEEIFVYDRLSDSLEILPVGEFVDNFLPDQGEGQAPLNEDRYYAISFDNATGRVRLSRIYAVIRHENNHQIVKIQTSLGQKIEVTDNHSLFSYNEKGEIIKIEPRKNPDTLLVPRSIDLSFNQKEIDSLKALKGYNPYEKDGKVFIGNAKLGIPRFIPLTSELCRLLGYYVSEGHLSCQVGLSLFSSQLEEDAKNCVTDVFNVPFYQRGNVSFFGGQVHVAFFEALCGRRAENKKIPTAILFGSKENAVEFLAAYLSGDGYISGNRRIGCSTTSRTLASHLWFLLARLECMPSIRAYERDKKIEINGVTLKRALRQHVLHVGKKELSRLRFVHAEKEFSRESAVSERAYDQKGYDYEFLRPLLKEIYGDRISLKPITKLSPKHILEFYIDLNNRLSSVDETLIAELATMNVVALASEYVRSLKEKIPYTTTRGLERQLAAGEFPNHSCHIRPSLVFAETKFGKLDFVEILDSLCIPRACDAGVGLNESSQVFDYRQLSTNMNMVRLWCQLVLKQISKVKNLLKALERCLNLLPANITKITNVDNDEYVYDIGVEEDENFLTADGIFAHNSQVTFTDFNLYWNVPAHFCETQAIGPGGEYTGKTYKDYEKEAQMFLKGMFEVYLEGDATSKTFVFPKPLLHINQDFFNTSGHEEFLDLACKVASKQGITYFVFDRGDEITVSQCLHPNTKILADVDGEIYYGTIENLCGRQIGWREASHIGITAPVGEPKKVKEIYSRLETKKMLKITLKDGSFIKVTADHPMLVKKKDVGEIIVAEADNLSIGDLVPVAKAININSNQRDLDLVKEAYAQGISLEVKGVTEQVKEPERLRKKYNLPYSEMKRFFEKDQLPVYIVVREGLDYKNARLLFGAEENASVPAIAKLNSDLGYFLGIFVAAGHVEESRLRFCFRPESFDYADWTENFINNLSDSMCLRSNKGEEIILSCSSQLLIWFIEQFVGGSTLEKKYFKAKLFNTTEHFRKGFLRGFLEVYTGLRDRLRLVAKFSLSSRELADDLRVLMKTSGINSLITEQATEGEVENKYEIELALSDLSKLDYTSRAGDLLKNNIWHENGADKDYAHLPIVSIEAEDYFGLVYDFEMVEEPQFHLANGVLTHNCCRLKLRLNEQDLEEAKTPEKMRFSALQNVTVNLPRIAYKAQGNDELLFAELNRALEIVAKAHLQKKEFVSSLLALGKDGPLAILSNGRDGDPYLRLDRLTYLNGLLGLNEMVQAHLGKQLHESDEALRFGLKVISHMNIKCKQMTNDYGIKMVLEESPAESSGYRLAKLDMKYFPNQTKAVIKGNLQNGEYYYTNSVHIAVDAPVDYIDRVQKQSLFHPLIEAGSICHIWLGEHEPHPESIKNFVIKTFKNTHCAQLAFSPEFTVCNNCRRTSRGLFETCPLCGSDDVYGITRIVGYFSKIPTWNKGKLGELKERIRTNLEGRNGKSEAFLEKELSQMPNSQGVSC